MNLSQDLRERMYENDCRLGTVFHLPSAMGFGEDADDIPSDLREVLEEDFHADSAAFKRALDAWPALKVLDYKDDDSEEAIGALVELARHDPKSLPAFLGRFEFQIRRYHFRDRAELCGSFGAGWGIYQVSWLVADSIVDLLEAGVRLARERHLIEWRKAPRAPLGKRKVRRAA